MVFVAQAFQKEREAKLIETLKDRLRPFVEGQTEEFVNWATSEAQRLSPASMFSGLVNLGCVLSQTTQITIVAKWECFKWVESRPKFQF